MTRNSSGQATAGISVRNKKREAKKAKGAEAYPARLPRRPGAGRLDDQVKRETSGPGREDPPPRSRRSPGRSRAKALAKKLKQHCGVGGTAGFQHRTQGDHRDKVIAYLEREATRP